MSIGEVNCHAENQGAIKYNGYECKQQKRKKEVVKKNLLKA